MKRKGSLLLMIGDAITIFSCSKEEEEEVVVMGGRKYRKSNDCFYPDACTLPECSISHPPCVW